MRYRTLFREWATDISALYRIGDTDVPQGANELTALILNRVQASTVKDIIGVDFREYKQTEEEVLETVLRQASQAISEAQYAHNSISIRSILNTAKSWIGRVTGLAISNGWSEREATIALANYLRGQTLTVSTTEAQWIVEKARKAVVVSVRDPLVNSVRKIADLFRQGLTTEARQLGRHVEKLIKLPLSNGQGQVVRYISESSSRLVTPTNQGRALANAVRRAEELGKSEKEWNAIFVRTRAEHAEADGQTVQIDEPFTVGGELLQEPGDSTLGASLWNIINCQCYSYFL